MSTHTLRYTIKYARNCPNFQGLLDDVTLLEILTKT